MRRILIAAGLLIAQAAHAQVQTFTNAPAFLLATSGMSLHYDSFDNGVANDTLTTRRGEVTFTWPSGTAGRFDAQYNHDGSFGVGAYDPANPSFDYFGPGEFFTATFDAPVLAVSLVFNVFAVPGLPAINTQWGSAPLGSTNTSNRYFVGLVSSTPFSSATFGGFGSGSGWTADDLMFGREAPVVQPGPIVPDVTPEPAALWLLASGFALLSANGLRAARARAFFRV